MALEATRFEIRACLGRGGFGEVYRAIMTRPGGVQTEVAVKILREDIDPGSESVKRLRDEGRLLGALRHPAILHVHDLVLLDGRVALVTEFVEGEDLDRCIADEPPIPARALLAVLSEVASALDAAWTTPSSTGEPIRLVHRDIKPGNVRVGRHGEVKLLDFGIARATNLLREAQTASNSLMGSYLYMAPERFRQDEVEPPSDVYALGCSLYEGIARQRFFEGTTLKGIYNVMVTPGRLHAHQEERLRLVSSAVPPEVVVLLRDLLHPDAAFRPTAAEASGRLGDLAESMPGLTLRRWVRERVWRPQPVVIGSLDGRELWASPVSDASGARRRPAERARRTTPRSPPPPPPTEPVAERSIYQESASVAPGRRIPRRPRAPDPSASVPSVPSGGERRLRPPTWPGDPSSTFTPQPMAAVRPKPTPPPPVPLAQQKTLPPAAVPEPLPAVVQDYESIDEDEISDPIPGVFGDEGWRSARPRRRSGMRAVPIAMLSGALLAMAIMAYGYTYHRPALSRIVEELSVGLDPWITEIRSAFRGVSPDGAGSVGPRSAPEGPVTVAEREEEVAIEGAAGDAEEVAPAPAPARAPEPPPAPSRTPQPQPQPVATPTPAPRARRDPTPAQLIERGWQSVEAGDHTVGIEFFDRVLVRAQHDPDALYGRGYALMRMGNPEEAQRFLCRARQHAEGSLRREIRSVMESHGLGCP